MGHSQRAYPKLASHDQCDSTLQRPKLSLPYTRLKQYAVLCIIV